MVQNSQGYQGDHLHPDSDHLANSPVFVACIYASGWGGPEATASAWTNCHWCRLLWACCWWAKGEVCGSPKLQRFGECLGRWNRNDSGNLWISAGWPGKSNMDKDRCYIDSLRAHYWHSAAFFFTQVLAIFLWVFAASRSIILVINIIIIWCPSVLYIYTHIYFLKSQLYILATIWYMFTCLELVALDTFFLQYCAFFELKMYTYSLYMILYAFATCHLTHSGHANFSWTASPHLALAGPDRLRLFPFALCSRLGPEMAMLHQLVVETPFLKK